MTTAAEPQTTITGVTPVAGTPAAESAPPATAPPTTATPESTTAPEAPPAQPPSGASSSPAPAAGMAPAPASGVTYDALAAALVRAGVVAAPAPAAAPEPKKPIVTSNLFSKGNLVVHRTWDPYEARTRARYGIVVETFPYAGGDDVGARSAVAFFAETSGPITDAELEGA